MKKGFDHDKYIEKQSKEIKDRLKLFDKLYLEVGGKLFSDTHAERVLPGFKSDAKIDILKKLKKDIEIIFCIKASDIEKNKTRAEYGVTYDTEILNLINISRKHGFDVNSVVITLFNNEESVTKFIKKLEIQNIKTYIHTATKGYPSDVNTIVSREGYGANPYIKTTKKIIILSAPGASSGKLATCLSQLYHDNKKGINAGYAKFETFPVWNLPLKHPVNLAYEAASANVNDYNLIDPYHLENYDVQAVNYNRDVDSFPILKTILNRIWGEDIYLSPTATSINVIKDCIIDMDIVNESSKKEIVRRYYQEQANYKLGLNDNEPLTKVKLLLNELEIDEYYLKTIKPALKKSELEKRHVISLELPSGKVITGKQTDLLSPASTLIINAIKELTKIPDEINLLSPSVLEPILKLRREEKELSLQEVLIALSICSVTNPIIETALDNINKLKNCDAHSTYIIQNGDLRTLKNLGINLTCEPEFYSNKVY